MYWERIEWLSGWLGDATIGRPPSFDADDYIADLDAANIIHLMRTRGLSFAEAANLYYSEMIPARTRAEWFLEHTPLERVIGEIFIVHLLGGADLGNYLGLMDELIEQGTFESYMQQLKSMSPDAYRFIRSLEDPQNHHYMWRVR